MIGRRRAKLREVLTEIDRLRRENEALDRQAKLAVSDRAQFQTRVRQLEQANASLLDDLRACARRVQDLEQAQAPDEYRALNAQVWTAPAAPVSLEWARTRVADAAHAVLGGEDDTIRFARPADVRAAQSGGAA